MGACHFCSIHDNAKPDGDVMENPMRAISKPTSDPDDASNDLTMLPSNRFEIWKGLMFCYQLGITEQTAHVLALQANLHLETDMPKETDPTYDSEQYLKLLLSQQHVQETYRWLTVDKTPSHIPAKLQFEAFRVLQSPSWDKDLSNVFVAVRDCEAIAKYPAVQRIQRTNRCDFLHGPVMTLHYMRCFNNGSFSQTIDLQNLVVQSLLLDSRKKARLLFHVGGVSAQDIFCKLLGHNKLNEVLRFEDIPKFLKQFGVGFVCNFEVTEQFRTSDQCKYEGNSDNKNDERIIGVQSMVLVGYRRLPNGKLHILLQNWWFHKQWIECDETYFQKTNGRIFFAELNKHLNIKWPSCTDTYTESYFGANDTARNDKQADKREKTRL
jgi:hypothetical protein